MKPVFSLPLLDSLKEVYVRLKKKGIGEILFSPGIILMLLVVLMIPMFVFFYSLYNKYDLLVQAEKRIQQLELKAKKTTLVRSRAAAFIKQLQMADKNFVTKHLHSLRFLQQEEKNLHFLRSARVFQESVSLIEREEALQKNTIEFHEITSIEQDHLKETMSVLQHPIEIDVEDLKKLLHTIEDPSATKPQLMLQSFSLVRKAISQSYELFECNFTLLERSLKEPS